MCSLCGVLGERHWTDSASHAEAFPDRAETTRGAERQHRTRLANTILGHYGLGEKDWTGASYVLSTRTGRTVMVDNLTQLWSAAEDLIGGECDPLDEALIARLGG